MLNKISIIVPVYNVEKYLPQCLESIINQTYKDLEIILINDGSTDSCLQICDEYALRDNRIQVIHQQNGGLSEARNTGLKIATGDFIGFVDSDDLISVDFYEKLLAAAINSNAEIVECNYVKFSSEDDLRLVSNTCNIKNELFNTEKALESLMNQNLKQVVWNKIYRKEILSSLQFPTGFINEDEFWTYKVIGNAKNVLKIADIVYFYRQQEKSIMGKLYNVKRLDGLVALQERVDYMKTNFPVLENAAIKIFCTASLWHYQQLNKYLEIDSEHIYKKNIINNVKVFNKFSILKHWKLKEVFWFQFFVTTPNFCVKFRNRINVGT